MDAINLCQKSAVAEWLSQTVFSALCKTLFRHSGWNVNWSNLKDSPWQPSILWFPWQLNEGAWVWNDVHLRVSAICLEVHGSRYATSINLNIPDCSPRNDGHSHVSIQGNIRQEEVPDAKLLGSQLQVDFPDWPGQTRLLFIIIAGNWLIRFGEWSHA